ncbi:MAG: hypothetical protein J07HX5_00159 [halophilic archaeon J07HX5]|nr:MAG: hypothetical protein J07HX5_00159 [halophilic archaeon J07HX5]
MGIPAGYDPAGVRLRAQNSPVVQSAIAQPLTLPWDCRRLLTVREIVALLAQACGRAHGGSALQLGQ